MKPTHCFVPERFQVIPLDKEAVKPIILGKHYLQTMPSKPEHCFGIVLDKQRMVGAVVFGVPSRREMNKSISPLIKEHEVSELLRLWIEDGHGSNIESWAIAQCFRILKRIAPEKKVVISFADPAEGHVGTIYQATGGLYQQVKNNSRSYLVNVTDQHDPKGWIHFRSQQRLFGRHSPQELKRKLCHLKRYWIKDVSPKYRYLWFLGKSGQKKKFIDSLKHGVSEYPKVPFACGHVKEIVITE